MKFGNVDRRILRLLNCERVGRVATLLECVALILTVSNQSPQLGAKKDMEAIITCLFRVKPQLAL